METLLAAACLALSVGLFAENLPSMLARLGHGESATSLVNAALATPWWLLGTSSFGLALLALLQGLTYLTAPSFCLLSVRSESQARETQRRARAYDAGEGVLERRLLTGTFVAAALVAMLLIGSNLLPQSTGVTTKQSGALSSLLGDNNPVTSPTVTPTSSSGGSQPTAQPGTSPTGGATATSTAIGGATATATDTPHPGASPSPRATPQNTPPGHSTPTPRPHP
jgi:hypothetical protein